MGSDRITMQRTGFLGPGSSARSDLSVYEGSGYDTCYNKSLFNPNTEPKPRATGKTCWETWDPQTFLDFIQKQGGPGGIVHISNGDMLYDKPGLSLYIYIYMYMYVCMHIYIHIYIYTSLSLSLAHTHTDTHTHTHTLSITNTHTGGCGQITIDGNRFVDSTQRPADFDLYFAQVSLPLLLSLSVSLSATLSVLLSLSLSLCPTITDLISTSHRW